MRLLPLLASLRSLPLTQLYPQIGWDGRSPTTPSASHAPRRSSPPARSPRRPRTPESAPLPSHSQTRRAAGDVREEVGTPSFTRASLFVALVLPMFPPIADLRRVPHPSREPLQFIVMSVI